MDLVRYRELLGQFHEMVLACGEQIAKVPGKWLAEFDKDIAHTADNQQLMRHLNQVGRSSGAIAILADGLVASESLPLSKGLLDSAASELLTEVNRLRESLLLAKRVLGDRGVQGLSDQTLSSVVFVMDYVQFDFNGSSLTAFTWPEWSRDSERLLEGERGYRDALCGLIGAQVASVTETADSLALHFTKRRNTESVVTG